MKLWDGKVKWNSTFINKKAKPQDESQVLDSFVRRNDMRMEMVDSRRCDTSNMLKEKKLSNLVSFKDEWCKWNFVLKWVKRKKALLKG
jgi:hypothetical protein